MSYRRSGVNDILWALYGLTVCAALTMQAERVCMRLGWEQVQWYLLVAAGCILLLFCVLFLPARLLSGKYRGAGKEARGKKTRFREKLAEGIYLVLLIAVSLALRLFHLRQAGAAETAGAGLSLSAFFGFPFASLTFSSLYAWLKLLLSSWADRGIHAAGFLPPLYETLGVLLLYPALRSLAGKLPAVTVTAALAFLPVFPGLSASGGQYGFFLTAAAVLLFFSSLYIENLSAGLAFQKVPSVRKSAVGWAVLSGLLAGAAVFLDSAFVPLLLFPIWASIFVLPADRTQQGVRSVRKAGGKKRAAGIAVLVLSAVLGYAAVLVLQVWISGAGPLEALMDRYGLLAGSFGQLPAETGIFWMIPVICLCILYIFAFFDQQRNVGSVWLLPFLLSTFRCVFAQSGGAECAVALLFWLIMAGMGLHGAFFREVKRKGRREAGVSASVVSASAVPATAVPGENGGIEERISTERRPLPGEPIPNPLPGPKKHERREMDYAFEPGEDRMFFDIDRVEEGDDFDYQ